MGSKYLLVFQATGLVDLARARPSASHPMQPASGRGAGGRAPAPGAELRCSRANRVSSNAVRTDRWFCSRFTPGSLHSAPSVDGSPVPTPPDTCPQSQRPGSFGAPSGSSVGGILLCCRWRDHTPLRAAYLTLLPLPIFQYPGLEPLADKAPPAWQGRGAHGRAEVGPQRASVFGGSWRLDGSAGEGPATRSTCCSTCTPTRYCMACAA